MSIRYIRHHFLDGVYMREAAFEPGSRIRTHRHKTEHMSILAKGTVDVTSGGVTTRRDAPAFILIPAGEAHEVRAVTDVLWFCTHITDESGDEAHMDEVLIEGAAHAV